MGEGMPGFYLQLPTGDQLIQEKGQQLSLCSGTYKVLDERLASYGGCPLQVIIGPIEQKQVLSTKRN